MHVEYLATLASAGLIAEGGKKPMIEHLFVDIFADHCPHKFAFAKLSYSSGVNAV
jgi:hypothetical protein